MEYKIGDLVVIRSWDSMLRECSIDSSGDINIGCIFTKDMREYCGNTYKIIGSRNNNVFKLDIGDDWNFSEEMFEKEGLAYELDKIKKEVYGI